MDVLHVAYVTLIGIICLSNCCDDLDSESCKTMAASRPDLCSDEMIAKSVCPKLCNACPVRCYSCSSTSEDPNCTATVTCLSDEVCIKRELKSHTDGHTEFESTCAKKTFCDNLWTGRSANGRRDTSRDVSVQCCDTDLCNHPKITTTAPLTTTTTVPTTISTSIQPTTRTEKTTTDFSCKTCCVDLMIAVDESHSIHAVEVKNFLLNVVHRLPISSSETLVSLGMFSSISRVIFDIGDHVTNASTYNAIKNVHFQGGLGQVTEGVNYLLNHALTRTGGDRPNYPNIVLIITDDYNSHLLRSKEDELHSKADHVISIELYPSHYRYLASSSSNHFSVHTEDDLRLIYHEVLHSICKSIVFPHYLIIGK